MNRLKLLERIALFILLVIALILLLLALFGQVTALDTTCHQTLHDEPSGSASTV